LEYPRCRRCDSRQPNPPIDLGQLGTAFDLLVLLECQGNSSSFQELSKRAPRPNELPLLPSFYTPFYTPFNAAFLFDMLDARVSLPLKEIAERSLSRGVGVVKGFHPHRVLQDSWRFEMLSREHHSHSFAGLVDFDPSRSRETHDPDPSRAGVEQVRNLFGESRLILSRIGVFDRERRDAFNPTGRIRNIAY
jgi:hypothetical protein